MVLHVLAWLAIMRTPLQSAPFVTLPAIAALMALPAPAVYQEVERSSTPARFVLAPPLSFSIVQPTSARLVLTAVRHVNLVLQYSALLALHLPSEHSLIVAAHAITITMTQEWPFVLHATTHA